MSAGDFLGLERDYTHFDRSERWHFTIDGPSDVLRRLRAELLLPTACADFCWNAFDQHVLTVDLEYLVTQVRPALFVTTDSTLEHQCLRVVRPIQSDGSGS